MQYSLLLIMVVGLGSSSYYGLIGLEKKSETTNTAGIGLAGHLLTDSAYNEQNFREKNQALFKKLGVTYLKNIEIISPDIKQLDAKHTDRYLRNPAYYDNLEKKYRSQIARGHVTPISVRFINDKIGYGVFAEADIAKDQFVGEYTGRVMDLKDIKDTKYTWGYFTGHNKYGKSIDTSLDAGPAGNEMRFVNHDYKPNVKMQYIIQDGKWHVCYVAIAPIKKGEQLLVDYGKRYWSGTRGEPHKFVNETGNQFLTV